MKRFTNTIIIVTNRMNLFAVYVDTGASTTSVTLAFTIGATTGTRSWKVTAPKVDMSNDDTDSNLWYKRRTCC